MSSARAIPEPTPAEALDRLAYELECDRPNGLEQARRINAALDAMETEQWGKSKSGPRLDESAWCRCCGQLREHHGVLSGACKGEI